MLATADLLPKEIYEVAYKIVHGEWPKYLRIETSRRRKLAVTEMEPVFG